MRKTANLRRPETMTPELDAWLGDDGEVEKYSDAELPPRPRTRADCVGGERPCPWVGCRYHLALDIGRTGRSIKFNHPALDIADLRDTCALDVADRGGMELPELAGALGLSYDRAYQAVAESLVHALANALDMGVDVEPSRADKRPPPHTWPSAWTGDHDLRDISAAVKASSPAFAPTPARQLTRDEVTAAFPGAAISPHYGAPPQPRPPSTDEQRGGVWPWRRSAKG